MDELINRPTYNMLNLLICLVNMKDRRDVSLRDRFNRLYNLSMLKGESVYVMSTLGWG